jgi:hypothetical protein
MQSTSGSDHGDDDKDDAHDAGVAVEEDLVPRVLPSKKKSTPHKELDFTFLTGADNEDDEEEEEEEAVEEKEEVKERGKKENDSDSIDDSERSASIRKQDEAYRNREGGISGGYSKKGTGMGLGNNIDSKKGTYSTSHADGHMSSNKGDSSDERDDVEKKIRRGAGAGTGGRIGLGADVRTGTGARMGVSTQPEYDDTSISTARTVHSRGPSIRSSEGGHKGRRETREKGVQRDEGNRGHRIGGDSDSLAQYARERCRSVAEMKYDRIFDNQATSSDSLALRGSKTLPLPLALSLPFPHM